MTSDAESGKAGGGIFASIGRLFGRGRSAEDEAPPEREPGTEPESGGPADEEREPAMPAAAGEEDEDELVLGPSLKAPVSGPNAGQDDDEDELTLSGAGHADEAASGSAEPSEVETEPNGGLDPREKADLEAEDEADAILARLRAAREEDGEEDADDHLKPPAEDEWAASFGAAVATGSPEATRDDETGSAEPWLTGDEDTVAEGATPDGPVWPTTGEPTEGEGMAGDDETDRDESEGDETKPREDAAAGGVALFPGAGLSSEVTEAEESGEEGEDETEESGDRERAAGEELADDEPAGQPEADEPQADGPESELATAEAPAVAEPEVEPGEPGEAEADETDTERTAAESLAAAEPGDEEPRQAEAGDTATAAETAGAEESGLDDDGADGLRTAGESAEEGPAESDAAPEKDDDTAAVERESDSGEHAAAAGATALALAAVGAGSSGKEAPQEGGETPDPAERPDHAGLDQGEVREIVRQMIREELSGDLGERLSANIRRMIREEVAQALNRR